MFLIRSICLANAFRYVQNLLKVTVKCPKNALSMEPLISRDISKIHLLLSDFNVHKIKAIGKRWKS